MQENNFPTGTVIEWHKFNTKGNCCDILADLFDRSLFQRYHGVISSLKFRVFETSTSKMLSDWSNILITMHWDGAAVPQVCILT